VHEESAELKEYKNALIHNDMQKIETLLYEHGRRLYWCICGATCLDKKNHGLHKRGCDLEYEEPSIAPHLEMSIEMGHIKSLELIKRLTRGKEAKLNLTSTQWVMSLSEIIKYRDSRVAKLFGYEWLVSFPYMVDRDKEPYAKYVYDMFGTMIANTTTKYPDLNITSLPQFIPILLPRYRDTIVWERLIPAINDTEMGELFLMAEGLESFRKIMVEEYGILWRVRGKKLIKAAHVERIQSLIRYVLYTHLGWYRPEHSRWFNSLSGYKQYLRQQTKKLIKNLMENPLLYDDLHHTRQSIAYFIPVPEAAYTIKEASKVRVMGWCCCFGGLDKEEREQEESLLNEEKEFVF
jgi:hypothetical protein